MAARSDLTTSPEVQAELLAVRRATAYLSRKVSEIQDGELGAASRLDGWSRAHVVAHLGYNARALCRLVEWANTGVETPMYRSGEHRNYEIEMGATLQPHALRHLFDHSAVSLNVEWRDTPDDAWGATVMTATGREVQLTETLWMRLRELWLHAIDLDNGGRWEDIPPDITLRLVQDILGAWRGRGLGSAYELCGEHGELVGTSAAVPSLGTQGASPVRVIRIMGPMSRLLAWASGRGTEAELRMLGAQDVSPAGEETAIPLPASPRWI